MVLIIFNSFLFCISWQLLLLGKKFKMVDSKFHINEEISKFQILELEVRRRLIGARSSSSVLPSSRPGQPKKILLEYFFQSLSWQVCATLIGGEIQEESSAQSSKV
jgi:hypothetical protein